METHKDDFESLVSRMKYYDSHPAISYWYCFWDDICTENMNLKGIKKHREFFDMTNRYAFAYHPVSIDKLKENLVTLGLRKKNGKGLFNDKILGKLEEKLDELGIDTIDYSNVQYVIPASEDSIKDPRCSSQFILPENATYIAQAGLLAWNGKE